MNIYLAILLAFLALYGFVAVVWGTVWTLTRISAWRANRRREAWLYHVASLPVPVVDWVAWEKQVSYE